MMLPPLQVMAEMQRIVELEDISALSRQKWKALNSKLLSQADLEASQNSRISAILKDTKDFDRSTYV